MSLDSSFFPPAGRLGEPRFGQLFGRSDVNLAASTSVIEGLPDEQRTSPVRRTFLLVMLFDLLLTFVLWIIYVQQVVSSGNIIDAMRSEVVKYTFQTSLFDTVILAVARFLLIEVSYGAFVARTPWWSACTTGVTCAILVAKCFYFNFHQHDNNATGLVYVLIISALILTWIETSFLIYRVIPQEKAAAHVATCLTADDEASEARSLLAAVRDQRYRGYSTYTTSIGGYHTPAASFRNYDIGALSAKADSTKEAAVDIAALLHRASLLRSEVWHLFGLHAWDVDSLSQDISIRSATLPEYDHRLYRIETILEASVEALFYDLVYNIEHLPTWNKTVASVESLQCLPSENIDIIHNTTHEILGGFISRRDFVLLRHWGEFDERHFLGITSVEHPKCPPLPTCIRAQQLISAFILEPDASEVNRCKLVWIMCVDMKISIPQRLVSKAMTGELIKVVNSLKAHACAIRSLQPEVTMIDELILTGSLGREQQARRQYNSSNFTATSNDDDRYGSAP